MKYIHIKTKAEFETESKILCPDWVPEDEYSELPNNQDLDDEENLDNDFPDDDEADESSGEDDTYDEDAADGDLDDVDETSDEESEQVESVKTKVNKKPEKSGKKK